METTATSIQLAENDAHLQDQEVLRLLSLLLQYPEKTNSKEVLREAMAHLPYPELVPLLQEFLAYLDSKSIDEWACDYVNTFDFHAATALYLTAFFSGEDRERGQMLVQLKELYEEAGARLVSEELPDYLPVFLEFISVAPKALARLLLDEFGPVIDRLQMELAKNESPYAAVIKATQLALARYVHETGVAV